MFCLGKIKSTAPMLRAKPYHEGRGSDPRFWRMGDSPSPPAGVEIAASLAIVAVFPLVPFLLSRRYQAEFAPTRAPLPRTLCPDRFASGSTRRTIFATSCQSAPSASASSRRDGWRDVARRISVNRTRVGRNRTFPSQDTKQSHRPSLVWSNLCSDGAGIPACEVFRVATCGFDPVRIR
jgi:hypothetical protein